MVLPALFLNVFFLVPFFVASSSTPVLCGLPVAEFRPWPCLPVAEFRVWPCLPVAEFRPLALPARCRVQALALPAQPGFAERSCQATHSLLPSGSAHGACTQNLVGSHVKIQAGVSSFYREAWSVCWLLPVMLGAATGRPSILGYRVVALIVSLFPFRN